MTAAAGRVIGPKPFNDQAPLPWALPMPLAASESPYRGWLMGINAAGTAQKMAAGTADLISGGFADRDQLGAPVAGAAQVLLRHQWVSGFPNSTLPNDSITASDYAVPFFCADNQTIGKLSSVGGVNRSLGGLAFGIDPDNNTPIIWPGPIAWLVARATIAANAAGGARHSVPLDGSASATTPEVAMTRDELHGLVTTVTITPNASLTANDTNSATITISKRDGAGGAPVTMATLTTNTASGNWNAFQPKAFVLSTVPGALNLLETDVVTVSIAKNGTGVVVPASTVRVRMKVQ